jgi:hypothetical protein
MNIKTYIFKIDTFFNLNNILCGTNHFTVGGLASLSIVDEKSAPLSDVRGVVIVNRMDNIKYLDPGVNSKSYHVCA